MNKKIEKQLKFLWEKVGLVVNLSQMVEYNLSNILAFDEILREFEATDSMFVIEYNEFAERANNWYKELSKRTFGGNFKRAKEQYGVSVPWYIMTSRENDEQTKKFFEEKGTGEYILIYAWNEWTEGGYLEPDTDDGYGYLEAIKRTFKEN